MFNVLEINQETKQKQCFLMHLIWQHSMITDKNIFDHELPCGRIRTLGNFVSLFNHSCIPNLLNLHVGNKLYCITLRPVAKGEPLFINYSAGLSGTASTAERQHWLDEMYQMTCEYSKCTTNFHPHNELTQIFQQIFESKCNLRDSNERLAHKEKLYHLLRKFGHLPWTPHIEYIILRLIECYCLKDNDKIFS